MFLHFTHQNKITFVKPASSSETILVCYTLALNNWFTPISVFSCGNTIYMVLNIWNIQILNTCVSLCQSEWVWVNCIYYLVWCGSLYKSAWVSANLCGIFWICAGFGESVYVNDFVQTYASLYKSWTLWVLVILV